MRSKKTEYRISPFVDEKNSCVNNVEKLSKKEKSHRMLGHINFNYIERMCKDELLEELTKKLQKWILKMWNMYKK